MWIHEDIAHIYELEHVMELTLTKKAFGAHSHTFKDVKDVVELWEWLDLGLLPTLVKHTDPVPPPPSVTTSRPLFRLLLDSTPCFLLDFLYQPVPVVVAYNLFVYSSPHLFYLYVDWALTTTRRLGLLGQVQPSDRRIENHAAPQ